MPKEQQFVPVCDVRISDLHEAVNMLDFIVDAYRVPPHKLTVTEAIAERAFRLARAMEMTLRSVNYAPPLDFDSM